MDKRKECCFVLNSRYNEVLGFCGVDWLKGVFPGTLGLVLGMLLLLQSFMIPLDTSGLSRRQALLLGSGAGSSTEAEVKVVVWLPESDEASVATILPTGWDWKIRAMGVGRSALSASSSRKISKAEEESLLPWYLDFSARVRAQRGQVYLEERVHEGIDIQRYFAQDGAAPLQWTRSGATTSLSGYLSGFGDPVRAGSDPINLQVLTRMNDRGGETLLALPVLLTEF